MLITVHNKYSAQHLLHVEQKTHISAALIKSNVYRILKTLNGIFFDNGLDTLYSDSLHTRQID